MKWSSCHLGQAQRCESRIYKHLCGRLAPGLSFPFLDWSHNHRRHMHGLLVLVLHFCLLSLLSWLLSGRFMVVPVSNLGKEMPAGTVSNAAELGRSWRFGSWTLKAWPVLNRSVQRSTESIRGVSRTSFEVWIDISLRCENTKRHQQAVSITSGCVWLENPGITNISSGLGDDVADRELGAIYNLGTFPRSNFSRLLAIAALFEWWKERPLGPIQCSFQ